MMLQFTDRMTGAPIWINPRQVSAVVHLKGDEDGGCAVLMAGGFELQVQGSADDVSAKVHKALVAY